MGRIMDMYVAGTCAIVGSVALYDGVRDMDATQIGLSVFLYLMAGFFMASYYDQQKD